MFTYGEITAEKPTTEELDELFVCDTCGDMRAELTVPQNYSRTTYSIGDADFSYDGNFMIAVGGSPYLSENTESAPVIEDGSEFAWTKTAYSGRLAKQLEKEPFKFIN